MNAAWRERIFAAGAVALGIWLSINLAEGSNLWPIAIGAIATGVIFVRLTGLSLDVVVLGGLLIGYIVGNRGFAQLTIVPGVPLLPAEIGLAIGGAFLLLRCARTKKLPWRNDALNYALLAWIGLGTGRIAFDLPNYGFLALRDYAMVYYAAFFFLTQHLAEDARNRRFLVRCLVVASVCLPPAFALFEAFPEIFLGALAIRGVPLIFLKGDLAPLFMAVGAVLLFLWAEGGHRWWARPLATGLVLWVCAGDNRAAIAGLLGAFVWTGLSRFRVFPATQVAVMLVAVAVLVALANITDDATARRRLGRFEDQAISIIDLGGRLAYQQDQGTIKSDNNQFRWIWWRTVVEEAMQANPVLGLGFGYDLARGFIQSYNPEMAEDFTARSPHNFVVTTIGRMGVVGAGILGWIVSLLVLRTWRVVRDPASSALAVALWAALWPIAISACLGVVLEGPMGAVVFWTLLGLAHVYHPAADPSTAGTEAAAVVDQDETSATAAVLR